MYCSSGISLMLSISSSQYICLLLNQKNNYFKSAGKAGKTYPVAKLVEFNYSAAIGVHLEQSQIKIKIKRFADDKLNLYGPVTWSVPRLISRLLLSKECSTIWKAIGACSSAKRCAIFKLSAEINDIMRG